MNENFPVSPTLPISTAIKILTPTADSVVDVQGSTVIVQFPVGSQVELRVNGALVDPSLVGQTESDATTNLVTQTWYAASLKEGANTISAQIIGRTEPLVTVQVAVREAPQQLILETVESRIPADGRSTATIRGQLLDANGNRSNRDAVVTLIPTAGELVGKDFKPDEPGFQVEAKGGQFTATLRSQLKAETVRIRAIANDLEAFTQLEFETALRPSLVTGVVDLRLGARGTNYDGSFRDFLPPDKNNGTQLDFHSAVFATKNTSGLPGSDRGIIWQNNGVTESLTNARDGDTAEYLSPGVDPTIKYLSIKCDGSNTNGVVVVNLGNVPNATAPGTPINSYGFIRFRGRVK